MPKRVKVARPFLFALALLVLSALACRSGDLLTASAKPTPTVLPSAHIPTLVSNPTQTSVVLAVEQTPSAVPKPVSVIWRGTISSNTSRAYMSNGSQVNLCTTDWLTNLTFVVDATGKVAGHAEGKLTSPRQCTPKNNLVPNLDAYQLALSGQATPGGLELGLRITSFSPGLPAGEFGGYVLLLSKGPCPGVPHTFQVPMTSATTAQATLNYSDATMGCGGSKDDVFKSDNLVKLTFLAPCSRLPSNLNDPEIAQLCQ